MQTHIPNENPHGASVPATETAADVSDLITKKVCARKASLSTRTIENLMKRRLIPWVALSKRCVRFSWPSVRAALCRLEVKEVK